MNRPLQVTIGPAQIYNHGNGVEIGVAVREADGYSNIRNFSEKAWEDLLLDSNLDQVQKAIADKIPLTKKHVVEIEHAINDLSEVAGSKDEIFDQSFSGLSFEDSIRKARLKWLHYWVHESVKGFKLPIIHVL